MYVYHAHSASYVRQINIRNFNLLNVLKVDWSTQYTGPDATTWPLPYYVNDFKVGIIDAKVVWYQTRGI